VAQDLPAAARKKLESDLKVSFKEAKVGGHARLVAPVKDQYEMTELLRPRAVEMERAGQLLFVGLHAADRAHRLFLFPARGDERLGDGGQGATRTVVWT
jgi:hypothetical protein